MNKLPRHQEWVDVKYGNRVVESFLIFRDVKGKTTAVVVWIEDESLFGGSICGWISFPAVFYEHAAPMERRIVS
jgi:hypothetical protein